MKIKDVENFFEELDKRVDFPVQIILTGGAAGVCYGMSRATQDIDFEVHIKVRKRENSELWKQLQQALNRVAQVTGITPQFSEDIDRWSSIVLLGKESRLYTQIGKIELRLLDPGFWAIGKLTRFLFTDINDLVIVLKNKKMNPGRLAKLWGRALAMSPPSSVQNQFRHHVEHFYDEYARKIWGKETNPEKLKKEFLNSAQSIRRGKGGKLKRI